MDKCERCTCDGGFEATHKRVPDITSPSGGRWIAASCPERERVAELLFGQPVTLQGLIEVIDEYGDEMVQRVLDGK